MDVLFFQSADPFRYLPMLAVTSSNVTAYCQRHGYAYESFVGLKRGFWPWQASYNRIVQYRELLDRGFRGWAVHLDADAWINDLDFDARAYLVEKHEHPIILTADRDTGQPSDLHSGVVLMNLSRADGRLLVERWHKKFLQISDAQLRAAQDWLDVGNDEDLLRQVFHDDAALGTAAFFEGKDLINSRRARFIRQHLRSDTSNLDRRIANIAVEVEAIRKAGSRDQKPTTVDDRALSVLRHPNGRDLTLVEAPPGPINLDAAAKAFASWSEYPGLRTQPHHQELRSALASGNVPRVARILADFGRSPAAEGSLGGPRQHRRAAEDPAFARIRALRTHDALTSLAEACGALRIENPDQGLWGFNVRRSSGELLDRIGEVLAMDVGPPSGIGGYLGIEAGEGRVLHLRMLEAIYSAWRIRQFMTLLDLKWATEIGGATGLRALYANRLGVVRYSIVEDTILAAVQTYLLAASKAGAGVRSNACEQFGSRAGLLFIEETSFEPSEQIELGRLRRARDAGVRAILSVNHEASISHDASGRTMGELVAALGGFRLAHRALHPVRPGYVEELFVATDA
jgi:hypothetical protein